MGELRLTERHNFLVEKPGWRCYPAGDGRKWLIGCQYFQRLRRRRRRLGLIDTITKDMRTRYIDDQLCMLPRQKDGQ